MEHVQSSDYHRHPKPKYSRWGGWDGRVSPLLLWVSPMPRNTRVRWPCFTYHARPGRTENEAPPRISLLFKQVTWESRHQKLQTLLRAAARRGYPASGEGMKWTRRAERWGGLAPPARSTVISIDSLRRNAQGIVLRAAKRGWDLRPSTGQSRPGSGGHKQVGGEPAAGPGSAEATAGSPWSAHDDGEGNTYYVNDFTGESVWEIPTTPAAAADASTGVEDWHQTAGEGEAAAWWDGGGGGQDWEHDAAGFSTGVAEASNPFGGYDWPSAGYAEGDGGGYGGGETATTGWEMATQQEEGGTEDWAQLWDEGSQAYYWYNSRTGESRW